MPSASRTVAALVLPGATPFELGVACEVFGIDRSDLTPHWYAFFVASAADGPLQLQVGATLDTPYGLSDLDRADTIIVTPRTGAEPSPPAVVVDALRAAHQRGARIMSLCTAAFTLAAAGLLDGRRATTHWSWARDLAEQYPTVDVDPKVLYIDEGDIMTSAGSAASVDLCLHVVRKDLGAEVANTVARRMVVPPHRDGGQAQFVETPVAETSGDDPLGATLGWMLEHLDEPVTVEDLAGRAHMSPRTFARRFRDVTGTSPHKWLLSQRILLAQRLLESTDVTVEVVAERSGFGSAANLRHHFQREVSTSPLAYRRTFSRAAG